MTTIADSDTATSATTGTTKFNAVFKGGGAKGIAYAGALQACRERNIEFVEVAGSSAGAITAALVACRYEPSELVEEMHQALGSIGNVPRSLAMIGVRPSLLGNARLHDWLADVIGRTIPGVAGKDCTFADIERVHETKLFVVTLDLATRQPRVFSPDLTPDSPVAAAVVASSAIPVAFPSARMVIDDHVHRLVDGGTWANYPAFVFHDDDFRECHELDENTRPTIGFILDEDDETVAPDGHVPDPESSPIPQDGERLICDKGSVASQLGVAGAILSSPIFRWLAALLPLMFVALSLMWLRDEMQRVDPWVGRLPEEFQEIALVGAVAIFSLTGLMAIAMSFAIVRLGRSLFDAGIVGAMAAIGVGPSVAYWVGRAANEQHTAIRITVPKELKTLSFDADEHVRNAALTAGYDATHEQLATLTLLGDPAASLTPLSVASISDFARPAGIHPVRWLISGVLGNIFSLVASIARRLGGLLQAKGWLRIAAVAYALIVGTWAAFNSFESFARDRNLIGMLWLGAVGSAVGLGAWLLANGRRNEATGDEPYPRLCRRTAGQLRFAGWASVTFAALIGVGFLSSGEASIVTTSRAAPVDGIVESVDASGETTEVVVEIADVDLAATLLGDELTLALDALGLQPGDVLLDDDLDVFFTKAFESGLRDAYGQEVEIVTYTGDTTSFRLMTDREPSEVAGDNILVRADLDRDRLFLDQDVWDGERGRFSIQMMIVVSLVLLGFGLRSLRAARWRSQPQPSIDIDTNDTDDDSSLLLEPATTTPVDEPLAAVTAPEPAPA